jgi:Sec7-like guanine-nucleotide exchange factor
MFQYDRDLLNVATRRYYMNHFDFSNSRVDVAFRSVIPHSRSSNAYLICRRHLCSKLFLRGESQVIDRILIEFSRRYWEQNTSSILGSASE